MASASEIIDRLGGTSAVATAFDVTPSTVHGWRVHNSIPKWRRNGLLSLAADKGVLLADHDFPTPAERVTRSKAA